MRGIPVLLILCGAAVLNAFFPLSRKKTAKKLMPGEEVDVFADWAEHPGFSPQQTNRIQ